MKLNDREHIINSLIMTILDLANAADKGKEDHPYWEACGMGCRALSGYLRAGAKAVIELQDEHFSLIESRDFARNDRQDMVDFLEEVFGERDVYCLTEEYKERLKEFIKQLDREAHEQE